MRVLSRLFARLELLKFVKTSAGALIAVCLLPLSQGRSVSSDQLAAKTANRFRVQKVEITSTYILEDEDEKITMYIICCKPLPVANIQEDHWEVHKRYSEFDQLRRAVMAADSESESETMGVKVWYV